MSREPIFAALFALSEGITWGDGQTFAERDRRLKMWDKAPQPSLYQLEPDEDVVSTDGQLDKRTLRASWLIYHRAAKDQGATPASTSNLILDAVDAAIRPKLVGARQTLGGLASRCFISGRIHKDSGDLDGQAMLIVPISIIVP